MQHKPFAEVSRVADVRSAPLKPAMTRRQRLERWAHVLESEPTRVLKPLDEIEWKPKAEQRDIRADGSPLTVAFEDPVLRGEGLASDRFGDASDFFALSAHDAHFALCSCMYGQSMTAGQAAAQVRRLIETDGATAIGRLALAGGGTALLIVAGLVVLIA